MPLNADGSATAFFDKKCVGMILLVIVNILWVLSSELTRFIFVDEEFNRPFFTVYLKSCTLILYMLRYLTREGEESSYKTLVNDSDSESFEMSCDSLSVEGFESVTEDSEVESSVDDSVNRTVRFSQQREVRRMPSSTAEDQRRARLPYRSPSVECHLQMSPHFKYTILFFAPLWLLCSFTYQAALVSTSVSNLNLISSSSSVFVLAFSICFPVGSNRFTLYKAILVAMNIAGVMIVSHYSPSLMGAFFAQISALSYAIYLTALSHFEERLGRMSINLMFGSIGLMALVIGTPMLTFLDKVGVESLYPMPNSMQLASILLSALFGTLVADYLWLLAAGMSDSLTASLSLTMAIPMSFLADSLLRSRPPTFAQLLAAVPITLSFVGAAFSQKSASKNQKPFRSPAGSGDRKEDNAKLIEDEQD
ncbi:unnamed protein product [Caenorhabditis auriculariae]|uniref:EamA domain-containing protein n=1 Tax=Caenorhabditis auriculariae TaxID=2777116 RepID=A0A8S1GMW9_9PELO|nr:unnamed protein product [Caenorhabditis auriculariae]